MISDSVEWYFQTKVRWARACLPRWHLSLQLDEKKQYERLKSVLDKLRENELCGEKSKNEILKPLMQYLVHVVTENWKRVDESELSLIKEWKPP